MNVALLLVLAVVWSSVSAQQTPNISKIERFIYDKCRIHSTEALAYDEIKRHYNEFWDYLTYTSSLLPEGKKQFCELERNNLNQMMAVLARDLRHCFVKKEKYIPKFLQDSLSALLTFLCTGKNTENFFSSQGNECRDALRRGDAGSETANCFKKFFSKFDSNLEKKQLCQDIKATESCFGVAITRHCGEFAGYESLNKKFFKTLQDTACSAFTFGVSAALVFLAFLATKFLS